MAYRPQRWCCSLSVSNDMSGLNNVLSVVTSVSAARRQWNVNIDGDVTGEQLHFFYDALNIAIGAVGYQLEIGKDGKNEDVNRKSHS